MHPHPEWPAASPPSVSRRTFVAGAAAGCLLLRSRSLATSPGAEALGARRAPLAPIGEAKGVHPGRVVWVHDSRVLDWAGPAEGAWYEGGHLRQDRVDAMMAHAVRRLTGETTVREAWRRLFVHHNAAQGRGPADYQPGERIVIKPNWVGMIWREGAVDPETYTLIKRRDYMNTAPQMILALMRQLRDDVGVRVSDITVCDSLAYLVHEYHRILAGEFPDARYVDFAGKFGRHKVEASDVPIHWSCRPEGVRQDHVPTCMAEAAYLINFAALKAHTATGVTLCGKNHFGSLVRWPVEKGYYDMHRHSFVKAEGRYREQVDLLGHAHLGGKTVLNLVDGLFCGKHPVDPTPRRMRGTPFSGDWAKSLLASQDPVAIDSVAYDFLHAEYEDYPRQPGAEDYLHEAALAGAAPSGTVYDPNHPRAEKPLGSLGVHEHWDNPLSKQYSRNLGTGDGIELVPVEVGVG